VADFERGDLAAIDRVLASAVEGDAITLANLVVLAPADRCGAVLARRAELVPAPAGVTVDSATRVPAHTTSGGTW
jgi:hypothetical protein